MDARPKTEKAKNGGASAPVWVGALIIAVGGFAGSWLSYQAGADTAGVQIEALEGRVGILETRERKNHDSIILLDSLKHSHGRRK